MRSRRALEGQLDRVARAASGPGRASAPSPESRRVRATRSAICSALDVDVTRCCRRTIRRRVRQQRRRARRLAGAHRGLRVGRGEDQPPRRRRSDDRPRSRDLSRARRSGAGRRTSTACRSARAAASSSTTRFRSTPSTSFEVGSGGGRRVSAAVRRRSADDPYVTLDGQRITVQRRGATRIEGDGRTAHDRAPRSIRAHARHRRRQRLPRATRARQGFRRSSIAGPFNADRTRRHAEPARVFVCRRRADGAPCATNDPRHARLARLPPARSARRSGHGDAAGVLSRRARAAATFETASSRRWRACSSIRSSSSASSASRRASRPARRTASATSSWRRGCRSSSGAAFRTMSCWRRRSAARCTNPAVLEQQVRRMLADPRADALVEQLRRPVAAAARARRTCRPDSPDFDGNLRQAFQRETEMLFATIVREDRSVVDLLDADYTFVDERLARHYGIPEHPRQLLPARSRSAGRARGAGCSARAAS